MALTKGGEAPFREGNLWSKIGKGRREKAVEVDAAVRATFVAAVGRLPFLRGEKEPRSKRERNRLCRERFGDNYSSLIGRNGKALHRPGVRQLRKGEKGGGKSIRRKGGGQR